MLKKLFKSRKSQRGAALLEYALLIGGIALMSAAAVSEFGHKTSDIISLVAGVLPGAHNGDNGPIISGHLIDTATGTGKGGSTGLEIDVATIANSGSGAELGSNAFGTLAQNDTIDGLVIESH